MNKKKKLIRRKDSYRKATTKSKSLDKIQFNKWMKMKIQNI